MKYEIADRSLMLILLLEECNFDCVHCIRSDELMEPGYRLSFAQLHTCLADCRRLESVTWVHFTGGEPTLWAEGSRSLVDLMLAIAAAGYTPGFTSNGSFFVNYGRCRDFFRTYVDGSSMPLRIYLTIDTFHRNFHVANKRARSLDNIIACREELPRAQADQLDLHVMAVISKDPASLLPDEMVDHYQSLRIAFGFNPLLPMGKGKALRHLCPDLSSDNPEDLGAYERYHRKPGREERTDGESQNRAAHINLIGDDYYFGQPWRKVGRLGRLPDDIICAYGGSAGA